MTPLCDFRDRPDGEVVVLAVDDFFVDLIGEDDEVGRDVDRFVDDLREVAELLLRVHRAAGIGGGVEDQQSRARRDRVLQLLGCDAEVCLRSRDNFANDAS